MEEFIEPSPEDRKKAKPYKVILFGSSLIAFPLGYLAIAHLKTLPPCQFLTWAVPLLYALYFPLFIFSAWVLHKAWLALKHGQIPPPGTVILRRTRVIRGSRARALAYASFAAGIIIIFVALYSIRLVGDIRASFPACSPNPSLQSDALRVRP